MNKCFCHFNGYEVKDAKARKLLNNVEFIFPKFWEGAYSGDANLIKYLDKVIMIDCYHQNMWNHVKTMLDDNGISHIDYLIITHYHGDHGGNVENLFNNGYIDSSTKFYMPANVSKWDSNTSFDATSYITNMKGFFTTNNLDYYIPYENEVLEIGDLKLTFYNTNSEILETLYWETTKNYNNTSTIVLINYRNNQFLYVGDATELAYKRLREDKFVKGRVDLFKIGHHGIENITDEEFIRHISPIYAVQSSGMNDHIKNIYSYCGEISLMNSLGTKIYPTHMQENYIKFVSNGITTSCINGKNIKLSNANEKVDLYVDVNASTSSIQDGSQDHPFSELSQAIGIIDFDHMKQVTIHLANGTYGTLHEDDFTNKTKIYGKKSTRIIIQGNSTNRDLVKIRGVSFSDCNVEVKGVTLLSVNDHAIYGSNSDIYLNYVEINTEDNNLSDTYDAIRLFSHSKLICETVKISNVNYGITPDNSSYIYLSNIYFGALNSDTIKETKANIVCGVVNFENDINKLNFNYSFTKTKDSELLFAGDTTESITLPKAPYKYDWIEIQYFNGITRGTTGRITAPSNSSSSIRVNGIILNASDDGLTFYQKICGFKITDNIIEIDSNTELKVVKGDNVVSTLTPSNYIHITKVVCGFNDYRDIR